MSHFAASLFALFMGELFALAHHGSLWVRRHFAERRGELASIHWLYPAGAPIAIFSTDWTQGYPGSGMARVLRYFWACLSTVGAVGSVLVLIAAR